MNFMDNKKVRKGKKPSKHSKNELKNFEELKLDESSSDKAMMTKLEKQVQFNPRQNPEQEINITKNLN